MDDIEFEDFDSTPVFSFDQVRPLTPPSSPEEVQRRKPKPKSNRQPQKTNTAIIRNKDRPTDKNRPVTISVGDESDVVPDRSSTDVELPKPKPKQKRPKSAKQKQDHTDGQRKKSSTAKTSASKSSKSSWPGDLKAIFDIDGTMCDVVMTKMGLSWSSVAVTIKSSKKRSKKPGESQDGLDHLQFEDILGIKIRREKKAKQMEGEGICLGMAIQTFERKDDGRLKDRLRFFGNPSEDICVTWSQRIDAIIKGFAGRPKKVKVFLQPRAGKNIGRYTWRKEILPVFKMAGVTDDVTDVTHNETIKHEMAHINLEDYDCVVCIGGDGTVSKVLNGLLTKTQKDSSVEMKASTTKPVAAPIPLGIIPTGTLNQICHTVQGKEDAMTGAIHILLGNTVDCDVCSVYKHDAFVSWTVHAHYGFFSTVLPYLSRYSLLHGKRIEAAFMKALTKSKFRSYECEISYIPASEDSSNNPNNGVTCYKGCTTCHGEPDANLNKPIIEEVKRLDLLDESANSDTLNELSEAANWMSIKSAICSVSILSSPAMSDLAPQGMSKYTHLADGCLDLIVVKNTDKKEFLRYLKRHGNNKNQLNLPFIEAIRCSEVKFHARAAESWKHPDFSYNEILDEARQGSDGQRRQDSKGLRRADSIEVIDDLEDIEDSSEEEEEERPRRIIKQSELGLKPKRSAKQKLEEDSNIVMKVSDNYRPTVLEQERARRLKYQRKKAEKRKNKDAAKINSFWNLDNDICKDLDLHFCIHRGLLRLCGDGIPSHLVHEEVKMGCLGIF